MRRAKIVATLGPRSSEPDIVRGMIEVGMDVARINLSHGTMDEHQKLIRTVRDVEDQVGRPIGIMLDTGGPEIRLSTPDARGMNLDAGATIILGSPDHNGLVPSDMIVLGELKTGQRLIVGDGNLILEVVEIGHPAILRVISGGWLDTNKKITCPGSEWSLPVLTENDRRSLFMAISEGIDWIAASFIRTSDDVVEVRRTVEEWGAIVPIMAKIETRLAVENLTSIVRLADGIMVARGDLGVEYPPEDVPWLQKDIITAANRAGKPVVTATQMLESMVHASRPTRAEVTDIAHAVLEGTDAVMLSEETAMGQFPIRAVDVMARAAEVAEQHQGNTRTADDYVRGTVTDAVCHAAVTASEDLAARFIITATESGHTAESMAAHRPKVSVLALTPHKSVARRLTLVWGLYAQLMCQCESIEDMVEQAEAIVRQRGLAAAGDRLVITAGAPLGASGSTNVLQVVTIGDVLLKGQGMGPEGDTTGTVFVVREPYHVNGDEVDGRILVTAATDAEWTPLLEKARAIITETPGLTSHAAIVGVSLGIPTIVGALNATVALHTGQTVTVDAGRGLIFCGPAS